MHQNPDASPPRRGKGQGRPARAPSHLDNHDSLQPTLAPPKHLKALGKVEVDAHMNNSAFARKGACAITDVKAHATLQT